MSYLERKTINGKNYVYFVKKISFFSEKHVIKKHIGIDSSTITKEKYLLDNINEISNQEFVFRKKFLGQIKEKISHSEHLPEKVEKKAIILGNLAEGKQCQNLLDVEFAKEFIFNSNNIEGSKIPAERVREIIDTGDTRYSNKNEVKEVKNSILAIDYLKKSFKFNLSSIKRLYNVLTKDLLMQGNIPYPKGFKKEKNIVGNSETTAPEEVETKLKELLNWYKENKHKIYPIILAFEFHKRYEFIHPFLDGNGRTGRLIMNKILISAGYLPIIVYKDNKQTYFSSLKDSRGKNPRSYYHFMLEQANKTYDYLESVIKRY